MHGEFTIKAYRKPREEEDYFKGVRKKSSTPKQEEESLVPTKDVGFADFEPEGQSQEAIFNQNHSSFKKKTKFVPLYSPEGASKDVVRLPGRHPCVCQATKHQLISNCLKCGRIVCSQEGSGPCLTCKNLVCSRQEQKILETNSKESRELRQRLMGSEGPVSTSSYKFETGLDTDMQSGLKKAEELKNRLLVADKQVNQHGKVIDDESDYFHEDAYKWLSQEDRERRKLKEKELHEKKHASRRGQTVTFDFAGRRILEEEEVFDYAAELELLNSQNANSVLSGQDDYRSSMSFPPMYEDTLHETPRETSSHADNVWDERMWLRSMRIQDKELQEVSDQGLCLSLHQPWASLLAAGIKIHEGRSWYTPYRGRLWVHAASKTPAPQEISEMEQVYRVLLGDDNITFPHQYPVGCLLGCVDLTDCLPQEEYRLKFPDGESASPYVFICENPQELVIKFPMKGKHKIFKLDEKVHQAAKKAVRKI